MLVTVTSVGSTNPAMDTKLPYKWDQFAITDEAAATLIRTSFSTHVRESHHFSCVLTDRHGNSLAQASLSIPSFIGTLPKTVKAFLRKFPPETLRPGDVLITNDMWIGTGHLPDVNVELTMPGGGGFGPPGERDRARVHADLDAGYVTPEGARRSGAGP